MKKISDFSQFEIGTVQDTINERFDKEVELQVADSEIRLNPHSTELALCPTLYWRVDNCHFVIIKTDSNRYKPQFFYSVREEYGTGVDDYCDIADSILALLQAQADHELKQKNAVAEDKKTKSTGL